MPILKRHRLHQSALWARPGSRIVGIGQAISGLAKLLRLARLLPYF